MTTERAERTMARGWFGFRLRKLLLFVASAAIVLAGVKWLLKWPSVVISGHAICSTQMFVVESSDQYPHALTIEITGQIDGRATIGTHGRMTTSLGPGQVDTILRSDWYDPIAEIHYVPENVTRGRLVIRYKFESL